MSDKQMPCGGCRAGTYAYGAIAGGIELFGKCGSRIEALRAAPRCPNRPRQICMGARDFIVAAEFPISESFKAEYSPSPQRASNLRRKIERFVSPHHRICFSDHQSGIAGECLIDEEGECT